MNPQWPIEFISRNQKHRMHVESSDISSSFLLKIRSLKFKYYTMKKRQKSAELKMFPMEFTNNNLHLGASSVAQLIKTLPGV